MPVAQLDGTAVVTKIANFNNGRAWLLDPRLTTVALPYFEIGRKAVELAVSAKEQSLVPPQKVLMPCLLVERESCRALM